MLKFSGIVETFEDTEAVGNKKITLKSKQLDIKMQIELPEKILYFDKEVTDELNIIIDDKEIKNESLKILIEGLVYSVVEKESHVKVLITLAGLPLILELEPKLNEFKKRSKIFLGMY